MCVYLRTKFQVSSIILASFRQGEVIFLKNEPLKSPPRLIRVKEAEQKEGIQMYVALNIKPLLFLS